MKALSENVCKLEDVLETLIKKLGAEFSIDLEEGLTVRQFIIMKLLHYEDSTVSELAEHLSLSPMVIIAVLEHMYHAGLINMIRGKANPGEMKISPTDKGVLTFKKSWEVREKILCKYFLLLDEEDQAKLIEIFVKILNRMDY